MLGRVSLSSLGLGVGTALIAISIVASFSDNATLNLVGFFYGVPVLLGGLALKASELNPVPLAQPSAEILNLRERQATTTQNQIRKDVTRYRYGQEAHLDTALEHLGLSPNREQRPVLQNLQETEVTGNYALILEFASPHLALETWQQKREKMETFFGPGIKVEITQPLESQIHLVLIANPTA